LRRSWPTAGYTFELKGQLHVARHFKRLSVASPTYRLLAGSRLAGSRLDLLSLASANLRKKFMENKFL